MRWYAPGLKQPIQAVAVDNEPEPFWTGRDEVERIQRWREVVSFRSDWGRVEPCGDLNGSSGVWVDRFVLNAFGVSRDDAWITDCLDTYHESTKAAARLDSEGVSGIIAKLGIPQRRHAPHPAESTIVGNAIAGHLPRLRQEIATANPDIVVTLGNAALRVLNALSGSGSKPIKKLAADESYGVGLGVEVGDRARQWFPLAHPAAPKKYQIEHAKWAKLRGVNA